MLGAMRTLYLALFCCLVGCACANQARPIPEDSSGPTGHGEDGGSADIDDSNRSDSGTDAGAMPSSEVTQMQITVGSTVFSATLQDNATAHAFAAMLPLTLNMRDVNANEKYIELPSSLPTNASNPGSIQNGDVMLYGSNGLVLFYESFPTSYSYTRIGRINDAAGLEAALGAGNVTVTFAR